MGQTRACLSFSLTSTHWMALQVTYKRLKDTLTTLGAGAASGPAAGLVDVLFGRRNPRFASQMPTWTPCNSGVTCSCRHCRAAFVVGQWPGLCSVYGTSAGRKDHLQGAAWADTDV